MSDLEGAVKKIEIQIIAAANKVINRQNTKKILDEAATIIRRRTLLGFGVEENGGARRRLKKLSGSYIEQRQGRAVYWTGKNGKVRRVPTSAKFRSRLRLSTKTTPGKSNLTLSGQLLDSIKATVQGPGRGFIAPDGSRTDGFTNQEIATFVEEAGREFLNLSNNEIKQLEQFAGDILRIDIEKLLTKLT